jgi:hypothetical protein
MGPNNLLKDSCFIILNRKTPEGQGLIHGNRRRKYWITKSAKLKIFLSLSSWAAEKLIIMEQNYDADILWKETEAYMRKQYWQIS